MRLCIGIVGKPTGWDLLLEQEGIPHERAHGALTAENFSAIVVGEGTDDREVEMVRQYLRLGGSVLCPARVDAQIRGTTSEHRYIEYVVSGTDEPFAGSGLVDVRSRCGIPWNANALRSEAAAATAFFGTHEGGHVIVLPFDAAELALDVRSARKSFVAPNERLPFERVSAVAKNGVRRIVRSALEHLHRVRGLPYVHLWYYPENAPSVFAFRIDTDRGSAGDIEGLFDFLRAKRVQASWFVDVGSQQNFLWRFAQMQGQEIGLHCYEHATWDDEVRNRSNILKARELMKNAKLGAEGFAAPYGIWNSALGRVISGFRFEYSSEFGWDYDNFPSFPLIDNDRSVSLQIPVHPISIGSLRRQGYDQNTMIAYFRRIVDEKKAMGEPLLFYHHPRNGHREVLSDLFDHATSGGVRQMTMRDWGRWWRTRSTAGLRVDLKGQTLRIDTGSARPTAWLRIAWPDGREALQPAEPTIDCAALAWQQARTLPDEPDDIERIRKFNYRIPLTVAVDAIASLRRRR